MYLQKNIFFSCKYRYQLVYIFQSYNFFNIFNFTNKSKLSPTQDFKERVILSLDYDNHIKYKIF